MTRPVMVQADSRQTSVADLDVLEREFPRNHGERDADYIVRAWLHAAGLFLDDDSPLDRPEAFRQRGDGWIAL